MSETTMSAWERARERLAERQAAVMGLPAGAEAATVRSNRVPGEQARKTLYDLVDPGSMDDAIDGLGTATAILLGALGRCDSIEEMAGTTLCILAQHVAQGVLVAQEQTQDDDEGVQP